MDKEKKIRIALGGVHIAFALLSFALSAFVFGLELGRSWAPSPQDEPNYMGMAIIIPYLTFCVGYCAFGVFCLRIAKGWILAAGTQIIGTSVRSKLGVGLLLSFHLIFVSWKVGRIVYLCLLVVCLSGGIFEWIYRKRLRALMTSSKA